MVVPLDSDFAVPRATAAIRGLLRQLQAAGMQGAVGLGILSMLGFDSTCQHLKVSRHWWHGRRTEMLELQDAHTLG